MHQELTSLDTVVKALPTLTAASTFPDSVTTALAQIDTTAYRVIDAAREHSGNGVLQLLLDAAQQHPEYTDHLIRDELVTLIVAGYETTAKTLAWLFVLLDQHREILEHAASGAATQEFIQALLSETLRLYPAVWLIPRQAIEDDVVDGYRIEAGTDILLSPYLTHRDAELWHHPDRFDPSRFLTAGSRPQEHGAYIPFGIGPRVCLGQQFALREMAILLGALLPRYRAEFQDTGITPVFDANLRPGGSMLAKVHLRR